MFSQKEVAKMPRKNLSAKQFIALVEVNQEQLAQRLKSMDNGDFLGIWRKTPKSRWYRLHLKTIWVKYYQLSYRTTKTVNGKARVGKEMLISNFPLPAGPVILPK